MSRFFDGIDDEVNAGVRSIWTNLSALTISAWIKPFGVGEGNFGRIVEKTTGLGPVNGWAFTTDGSTVTNGLSFFVDYDNTNLQHTSANNTITLNVWQHVAITWDGSTTAANAKIYVNGVETSYGSTTNGSGIRQSDASAGLRIGNDSTGARTFSGLISNVTIYNRVLSLSEIMAVVRDFYSYNGLVGLWPLFGSTSPEPELSGNNNNGSVSGTLISSNPPTGSKFHIKRNRLFSPQRLPNNTNPSGSRLFDGVDDTAKNAVTSYRSSDSLGTIAAWIKLSSLPLTFKAIFASRDEGSVVRYLVFYVNDANNLSVWQRNNDTASHVEGGTTLSEGIWYHVTVVSNGTDWRIFLNGNQETLAVGGGSNNGDWFADTDLRDNITVGYSQGTSSIQYFPGFISDVRVYDVALSISEVRMIMSGRQIESNPVGYWPFWGTTSPEPDLSGFNFPMTISGAVISAGPPTGRRFSIGRNRFLPFLEPAVVGGGTNYTQDITQGITVTANTVYKDYLKYLTEVFTLSEVTYKDFLKYVTQTITLSETHFKDYLKYINQPVTLTETHYKDYLKYISQAITLTESILTELISILAISIAQSISLTEIHYKDYLKYIPQSITLSEIHYKDFLKYLTQLITISEVSFKDYLKYITQNITLTEIHYKDFLKYILQSVTVNASVDINIVTTLVRRLTFLTLRSMLLTHDKLAMERDLVELGS